MSANRGASLDRLRGAVERGRPGESSVVLVHGGIGVGKSWLLDRLAVSVGLLGLLTLEAEERAVLVVADDVHWLDNSTTRAAGGRRIWRSERRIRCILRLDRFRWAREHRSVGTSCESPPEHVPGQLGL